MEWLQALVVTLLAVLAARTFVAESFVVRGHSMEPTVHHGERVLVLKAIYRWRPPRPGDIVVFRPPGRPGSEYIKRVVAISGSTVRVARGRVYRDGRLLAEPYVAFEDRSELPEASVPPGAVFVLGDNRPGSDDSRLFGPVPLDRVDGRAVLVYWPPWKARWLH
ncbi:MAG TPA: signal peptidase I [Thermaerobacter sp.]